LAIVDGGQRFTVALSITIPAPGLYRVAATAEGTTMGEFGDPMQAIREQWMLVLEDGGRLVDGPRTDLIPDGYRRRIGPLRPVRGPRVREAGIFGWIRAFLPLPDVTLDVSYYHSSADEYREAGGAKLTIELWDETVPELLESNIEWVDSSGLIELSCPDSGLAWDNGDFRLPGGVAFWTPSVGGAGEYTDSDCGQTDDIVLDGKPTETWMNLRSVIPAINSGSGYSRSLIEFVFDSVFCDGGAACFDPITDRLVFDPPFSNNKRFAGHEYAHSLHDESLGSTWTAESACYDVTIRIDESSTTGYKCALLEGWPRYWERIGIGETTYWATKHFNAASGRAEAEVEGNVAAMLHDLIASYGGFYVSTVFKTCKVPSTSARVDASDLVWCLENRIDGTEHSNSFPGISTPSSWSEGANENATTPETWNADTIRVRWTNNIGG
jgi:hypothetical protein